MAPSVRSLSVKEAVPEVRDSRRGLEDLRRRGAQNEGSMAGPGTLTSHMRFQRARVERWFRRWARSRAAAALWMRTSSLLEERVSTAVVMEESEVRSIWTTLIVLLVFGGEEDTVFAASLPFCSSRDARMMWYGTEDSQRACTVARPTALDQHRVFVVCKSNGYLPPVFPPVMKIHSLLIHLNCQYCLFPTAPNASSSNANNSGVDEPTNIHTSTPLSH